MSNDRLTQALTKLASMKAPSVADILKKRGFAYEAGVIEEVLAAFEESTLGLVALNAPKAGEAVNPVPGVPGEVVDAEFPATDEPKEGDEPLTFRNYYRCPDCGHEWEDVWDGQPDDDCPSCHKRHISPYDSEDAE